MSEKNNDEKEEEKKKEIQVISGDGKDLDISPVYDHVKIDESDNKTEKKEEIIIPKKKK